MSLYTHPRVHCRACAKRVRSVRELARKHVNLTQTRSRRSRSRRRRASRRRSCGESVVALPSAAHRIRSQPISMRHSPAHIRPLQTPGAVQGAQRAASIHCARRVVLCATATGAVALDVALTRRCTSTSQASVRTLLVWLCGRLDLRAAEDRADRAVGAYLHQQSMQWASVRAFSGALSS